MLTLEKVKLYKSYSGDIDGWSRMGTKNAITGMTSEDWYLIEGFIQDLKLINGKLAADSFAEKFKLKLADNCEADNTEDIIKALSE